MNIRGIDKTSLIDYPGKICAVLFCGGCNLRCGYCHNPDIARNSPHLETIENDQALHFLKSRKKVLDGVTLSGGEPTLSSGLIPFIQTIKEIPLLVKLDTNGLNPAVLQELLDQELIDYAAVDIKTSPEKYQSLTTKQTDFNAIGASVRLLQESGIEYEVRTTCVPGFAELDDFVRIRERLGAVRKYFLQQFIPGLTLMDEEYKRLAPYPVSHLMKLREFVAGFADICTIRGI